MNNAVALREQLLKKQEHIDMASRALKAMAHPLRLKILCILGNEELSVQEIVDCVGTSQSNISQHLAILRKKTCCAPARMPTRFFTVSATNAC